MVFFRAIIFFSCLFIDIYTWRKLLWTCWCECVCACLYVTKCCCVCTVHWFRTIFFQSLCQHSCTHLFNKWNALTDYRYYWYCDTKKTCDSFENVIFTMIHILRFTKSKKMCFTWQERLTLFLLLLVLMPPWFQCHHDNEYLDIFFWSKSKRTLRALSLSLSVCTIISSQTDAVWSSALFKRATIQCFQMKWIKMGVSIYVHRRTNYKTDNIEKNAFEILLFFN